MAGLFYVFIQALVGGSSLFLCSCIKVSVLVDVLYRPELLFPAGPDARRKCENGGFIRRLITHTAALLGRQTEY